MTGGGDGSPNDQFATQRDPDTVRAVYDEIADHFSETRAYPWPEIEDFLDESLEQADVGLDLGCGNGRHAAVLAASVDRVCALDLSRELLRSARERMESDGWDAHLVQGDAATIPLASDSVGLAVYVATLHHLPDRETRVGSLSELARVLTPDGRALVSAWSTAHDRFDAPGDEDVGFDTTIEWTLPDGETVDRFYHIYSPAEFEQDLRASGLTVERTFLSSGNCYAQVSA